MCSLKEEEEVKKAMNEREEILNENLIDSNR
jgi:hypothetical protein